MSGKLISPQRKKETSLTRSNDNLHFPLVYNPISRTAFIVGLSTRIHLCVSVTAMETESSNATENDNIAKKNNKKK